MLRKTTIQFLRVVIMTIKSILCFSVVTLLALPASAGDFLQGTYIGFAGSLVPNAKEDLLLV